MITDPTQIFEEYRKGTQFKSGLGNRGLFEQSRINERFYIGDQWYGARCGNDKPLVRHNVIKRIGDYKMSQILNQKISMTFSSDGIPPKMGNSGMTEQAQDETMSAFSDYFEVTSERVGLDLITERILKNAYISGTAVLYTYWDPSVNTGMFVDGDIRKKIKGDICCEVLNIGNVVFADPFTETTDDQPYIIISSCQNEDTVLREAGFYGSSESEISAVKDDAHDGKITVYTKLYKKYDSKGNACVMGVKVTERAVVRSEFSTGLKNYPVAVFRWDSKNGCVYGDSEITYLIPNQIAINRMITANVWSAMTAGMPIMLVNGDTVNDKITNDPGQIIKVYGSNEDVAGAVKYVSPASSLLEFDRSINTLITNTLTQSGANEVALGDSKADNATALITMRDAAILPLKMLKIRYYSFLENVARIWADFWISHYSGRGLHYIKDGREKTVFLDIETLGELMITSKVTVNSDPVIDDTEKLQILITLFEKGIINKRQLLDRIPENMVNDISGLLRDENEGSNEKNDGV